MLPIVLIMCFIIGWQLYQLQLLIAYLRPILERLRLRARAFLYPPPPPAGPRRPHLCAEHASAVPALDRVGRPDYFALHAHRARDLGNLQVGSYAAGAARWWTAEQRRARDELVGGYLACPPLGGGLSPAELEHLFARIDAVFFCGALTRGAAPGGAAGPPVRLVVVDYDAFDLRRIYWRYRCALVGYTDVADAGEWVDHDPDPDPDHSAAAGERRKSAGYEISRPVTITLARRFAGQALTKAELLEALCHECVHAFARLYWEYCPREAVLMFGGGDGHGKVFHVMLSNMIRTMRGWHPELARELAPGPGPGRGRRRHFSVHAAPPGGKRRLVLAVFALLDLLAPYEERALERIRRAGRWCVRHELVGVVLGLWLVTLLFKLFLRVIGL